MGRPRNITPPEQRARILRIMRAAQRSEERYDEKLAQAVRDAHVAGGSVRDIAELTGRSTSTIQRWLKG